MPKTVLLLGSIGTIVETSDIQRRAYNQAMHEAGLRWQWDETVYRELLTQSGGLDRLSMLARATGQHLDPAALVQIHARKTELACAEVTARQPALRPGVEQLMALAAERGWRTGFVTSTERANIDAILGLGGAIAADRFDVVIGRRDVVHGKPHPQAFLAALEKLGARAADAIAIEDTATSVMAAVRAGITTVAVPGANAQGQDFWQADLVLDELAGTDGKLDARLLTLIDAS